jgi:hypothetical protein
MEDEDEPREKFEIRNSSEHSTPIGGGFRKPPRRGR